MPSKLTYNVPRLSLSAGALTRAAPLRCCGRRRGCGCGCGCGLGRRRRRGRGCGRRRWSSARGQRVALGIKEFARATRRPARAPPRLLVAAAILEAALAALLPALLCILAPIAVPPLGSDGGLGRRADDGAADDGRRRISGGGGGSGAAARPRRRRRTRLATVAPRDHKVVAVEGNDPAQRRARHRHGARQRAAWAGMARWANADLRA